MNILFLSDVYFPRINGVSTSIRTLRAQLADMGHHVRLVAPEYHAPSDDESWIVRVPSRYLPFDPEDRLLKRGEALRALAERDDTRWDILHIHTPFAAHYLGLDIAKRSSVPVVETYHTFFEDYMHHYLPVLPRPALRAVARSLSRRQCNAVDAVVAPSQPMLDALRGYGMQTRAEVIPTGLDEQAFRLGDGVGFRRRYGIPAERPVLLYVGRVAHEKNIGFLLQVLQQVRRSRPDVLLVIAGEGPALEGLRRQAEAMGLHQQVLFLGYLDRNTELNDCYRAADVFVFSSLTETQGLVLLEAMAQGVPVVAIAEMGTKSILREGEGARVAPHAVPGFADGVLSMLGDADYRAAMGIRAQAYARQWSARSMSERMLAFYEQVVAGRPSTMVETALTPQRAPSA